MDRIAPPDDISPIDFFTRWIPEAVAGDEARRTRLSGIDARIVFELAGEGGGSYTLDIVGGIVQGAQGAVEDPDLRVVVDIDTWRALNRGDVGAPEAMVRRKIQLHGDFLLGLKLHFILG
jgi:putative sterol carrier protein